MLREGGAVSGLDIILVSICSGKLYIYRSVFYLSKCKTKLLGIITLGFDEMRQLMITYFGFFIYLRGEGLQ